MSLMPHYSSLSSTPSPPPNSPFHAYYTPFFLTFIKVYTHIYQSYMHKVIHIHCTTTITKHIHVSNSDSYESTHPHFWQIHHNIQTELLNVKTHNPHIYLPIHTSKCKHNHMQKYINHSYTCTRESICTYVSYIIYICMQSVYTHKSKGMYFTCTQKCRGSKNCNVFIFT